MKLKCVMLQCNCSSCGMTKVTKQGITGSESQLTRTADKTPAAHLRLQSFALSYAFFTLLLSPIAICTLSFHKWEHVRLKCSATGSPGNKFMEI